MEAESIRQWIGKEKAGLVAYGDEEERQEVGNGS
jgi:hypothetical protein